MATAAHKGAISVSLLHIPCALYTATQDVDLHFNQLCPDGSRVRFKKVCESCGEEIPSNKILRGYQISPDQFIVIDDADIEAIKTPRDRTIQIQHTCDRASIPTVFYDKTYHMLPEPGGERAYELFRTALLTLDKVAIAKTVMGNSETLLALIPTKEELIAQTLFFADELKDMPKPVRHLELSKEELKLAEQIVSNLERPFEASEHHNEFQRKLRDMVEAKAAGREIIAAPEAPLNNIVNLMEALTAAAKETGSAVKPAKKAARTSRKKNADDAPKSPAV